MEKQYMNVETGSVGTYHEWWYPTNSGMVNAVDRGEVIEVEWECGTWVEV